LAALVEWNCGFAEWHEDVPLGPADAQLLEEKSEVLGGVTARITRRDTMKIRQRDL
jgi:hypothetical protein